MPAPARRQQEAVELNLAPILSILVILIPVILIAFNLFEVKVHAAQAPRIPGKLTHQPKPDKPLQATVIVTHDGFELKTRDSGQAEPIPRRADGTLDYPALERRVIALKAQYPREHTVYVGASPSVHWNEVAVALDAVRVTKDDRPLFERVVFVVRDAP